jgi:hypothetical protein
LLESDPGADVDESQVVVEDVLAKRDGDHEPGCQRRRDQKEPGEGRKPEVSVTAGIQPAEN